jgi:SAM-dependent methyltransferase
MKQHDARSRVFSPRGGKNSTTDDFSPKDFPGFSKRDFKALELYYSRQLARHQEPEKRVGWQTAESQRVRFETFCQVGPLARAKILDVGCGLGAFFGYLREKRIRTDYTGVDLFPGLIREAKRAYPKTPFEVRNVYSRPFPSRSFDYAFLSGVFNVKVRDNWKYMKALITSVLKQTGKAVAFNVLNSEAGIREKNRFTVKPGDLVTFGRRLKVSRVHLIDHYHRLDLTLFLYK